MSNIISFPTAADRAVPRLEAALAAHDIATILEIATTAGAGEVRNRAARWLIEVLNVRVSA